MKNENHLDIGSGIKYCREHFIWFKFGYHCPECEKEKITRCVENEEIIH